MYGDLVGEVSSVYDLNSKRVWVAGHRGMVGEALMRRLTHEGCELITASRSELDLRDQAAVDQWMQAQRLDAVVIAAAKVGGISANNSFPADFLYDNLMIATNIIHAAHRADVGKLLFLGSTCIYPRLAPQPIPESSLLTGPLEPTNEWYAIAKIAGIKLCQAYRRQYGRDFISAMPTNLYGPHDNFHPDHSHVIPGLMRRAHDNKVKGNNGMTVWGSGKPRREFLHVDDCADALVHLLVHYSGDEHVNVGSGVDYSIEELASLIMDVVGLSGQITFDASMPDGTPRKLTDVAKLRDIGWVAKVPFRQGLEETYAWYLANVAEGTHR